MELSSQPTNGRVTDENFALQAAMMRKYTFYLRLLGLCFVTFFSLNVFVQFSKLDFVMSLPQINRGSRIRESELEEFFHIVNQKTTDESERERLSNYRYFSLASDETNAKAVLMGYRQSLMLMYIMNIIICISFVILSIKIFRLPRRVDKLVDMVEEGRFTEVNKSTSSAKVRTKSNKILTWSFFLVICSVLSAGFRFVINYQANERESRIFMTFNAIQDTTQVSSKFTHDYLSNAVAKHLSKVKSEESDATFAQEARLAIYGNDFEADINSTLRTGISLCIILIFNMSIVRICFHFVREWEKLKNMIGQRVLGQTSNFSV